MREQIKENDYAFNKIYNQLEKTDFTNFICSPLVNGGCGLGKTTALTDDRTYELFKKKLKKPSPQILVIESRSMTRDQLKEKNTNPNYHFYQFDRASTLELEQYDIVIIDEAHSLFSDAEFASRATTPLAEWLKKNLCFQIYITASDEEFISYAEKYFTKKEFDLTFPDLTKVHTRYLVQKMYLSLNTEKTATIIERKRQHFFEEYNKGLFFVISAKQAAELFNQYSLMGYRCGFYISQQNTSQLVKREEITEEDPEFFEDYASREIKINVLDYYTSLEQQRKMGGKETIREALLRGTFPDDIDYLFITSTGQEGISLNNIQMDFVFIEDTYPLTINQKIFRYRDNVKEVYLHLPQRRIEHALLYTMNKILELRNASQDYLKGFYEGAGGKKATGLARAVWFDKNDGLYKVSDSYVAYLLTKSQFYRELRDNKENYEWMRSNYGQYAEVFELVSGKEDKKKDILENFFRNKDGVLLTETLKKQWLQELKDAGLTNNKQDKDYTFNFVVKYCRENGICQFNRKKANQKDVSLNPELKKRKEYLCVSFPKGLK